MTDNDNIRPSCKDSCRALTTELHMWNAGDGNAAEMVAIMRWCIFCDDTTVRFPPSSLLREQASKQASKRASKYCSSFSMSSKILPSTSPAIQDHTTRDQPSTLSMRTPDCSEALALALPTVIYGVVTNQLANLSLPSSSPFHPSVPSDADVIPAELESFGTMPWLLLVARQVGGREGRSGHR